MVIKREHQRIRSGVHQKGLRVSGRAMAGGGMSARGFIFCPHGEAVYFKKSWHKTSYFFDKAPDLKKAPGIIFRLCPAHEMLKNHQYEGEIVLLHVPEKFKKEIMRLVEAMDDYGRMRDVLDRVLTTEVKKDEIRFTTSENQLAKKIGKKIVNSFKNHATIDVRQGKEGDLVRVYIDFLGINESHR